MKDTGALQSRYLRDPLPVRLGGLSANLARINSFSDHPDHSDVVKHLVNESKWFIEWAAPDAELEVQATLVELQIQLALWQETWEELWRYPEQRLTIARQAQVWSNRILEISGLLR
jgi:hypothetical protein